MKWEPVAAMVALIALAIWLVASQGESVGPLRDGAEVVEIRIGQSRGVVERDPVDDTYRVLLRDAEAPPEPISRAELNRLLGESVAAGLFDQSANGLFRILNITSWVSLAWIAVGLLGQVAFFLRMALQWIASERRKESVVPEVFWWLSLGGGIALFSYFVWRRDLIGVLGQTTGVVIYARNIRLILKRKRAGSQSPVTAG